MTNSNNKPIWATRRDKAASEKLVGLACLVPNKESVSSKSMLLSDHDYLRVCECDLKDLYRSAYDQALADVIALAGAFDEVNTKPVAEEYAAKQATVSCAYYAFLAGARWQHQQLKAKLGGDT